MMLGTVSTILASTIVNVAFPALIDEFHVGHDTLQWIAAGAPASAPDVPVVERLEIVPAERVLAANSRQQLAVIAH